MQWNPVNGTKFFIVDTHPCSDEELGLTENIEDSQFFLAYDSDFKQLETYAPYMQCIDEDYELYGEYSSVAGSLLSIYFQKCMGDGCKNDTEIAEFLRRKFIFTLTNEIIF